MTNIDKTNIDFYEYTLKALINKSMLIYKDILNSDLSKDEIDNKYSETNAALNHLIILMTDGIAEVIDAHNEQKLLYDIIIDKINKLMVTAKSKKFKDRFEFLITVYKFDKELLNQIAKEGGFIK